MSQQERLTDTLDSREVPEDLKGLSQSALVRKRFLGHTGAIVSLVVLAFVIVLAISAVGFGGAWHGWWQYNWKETPPIVNGGHPTLSLFPPSLGQHPFGQDSIGRDYFAMTMRGAQISLLVTVMVGLISGLVGVIIGAMSGFFRGITEAILMRFTDIVIIIPLLLLGAVVAFNSKANVFVLGALLGLTAWTGMARLVRGDFLTLREREFVDAARLAGASNSRIIFKHILPNAIGVITVNTTLLMSSAILLETALSYLGMGVRPPDTSLGLLISENQAAFQTRPWLFWWPGLFIVVICLSINFVGDGLRDAFDPRQKKLVLKRVKEADYDPLLVATQASALPGAPLSEIVGPPVAAGGALTTVELEEGGRR